MNNKNNNGCRDPGEGQSSMMRAEMHDYITFDEI